MTRRSSAPTCSSSPATGRCTSRRLTRATCWLMLFRFGERLDALLGIEEADIHGEHAAVQIPRVGFLALLLERAAEPVEHAEPLLIAGRREVETAAQDRFGDTEGALLEEADAQHLRRAQLALGGAQRLLQLRDGLVEHAHLLERDTEIVVGLEVGLIDVFVDALLEARQHVLEILLLVSRRLLVRDGHARVFRRSFLLVVAQHRAEVDEVAVQRGLVADFHLGVFRLDLALRLPRLRRDGGRSEEHTSELQSRRDLVCRLLLEKKKNRAKDRVDSALILASETC